MSPNSSFLSGQRADVYSHWKKVFGEPIVCVEDVGPDEDLSAPVLDAGSRMFCDKLLVARFEEDTVARGSGGGRVLFSAREEDEHPDIVGNDE
jgi:hypothetical protein